MTVLALSSPSASVFAKPMQVFSGPSVRKRVFSESLILLRRAINVVLQEIRYIECQQLPVMQPGPKQLRPFGLSCVGVLLDCLHKKRFRTVI